VIFHFYLLMGILFTIISYGSDPERSMKTAIIAGILWPLGVFYVVKGILNAKRN